MAGGTKGADRAKRAVRASSSARATASGSSRNGVARRVRRWVRPLGSSKTIRWSKVMTAQARIATGYYDRKDVKEMVLEAVLKELARH